MGFKDTLCAACGFAHFPGDARYGNSRFEDVCIQNLQKRLAWTQLPLDLKIARYLEAFTETLPDDKDGKVLDCTQEWLADMIGSARETMSSRLNMLKRQGVLKTSRGKLVVDRYRLRTYLAGLEAAAERLRRLQAEKMEDDKQYRQMLLKPVKPRRV